MIAAPVLASKRPVVLTVVRVAEALAQLHDDVDFLGEGERHLVLQDRVEITAAQEFHDDVVGLVGDGIPDGPAGAAPEDGEAARRAGGHEDAGTEVRRPRVGEQGVVVGRRE